MTITREEMVRKLSEKSGYWQKDIRYLLQCLDEIVFDELLNATVDEEISLQLVSGFKLKSSIVPERERVNPRNLQPIVVPDTIKPACKISQDFKMKLQDAYNKKNG